MPGQEREKSEGGEEVNPEQVRSVIEQVLAEKEAKGKTTQDLGTVKREVSELRGELGKIKEGMHCTPDGKYCFRTPGELSDWMAKQGEKMDGLDSKIAEVATQVKQLKPVPSTTPERLPDITSETRAGMSKEADEGRDQEVTAIANYFNMSLNDLWRQVTKDPVSLDVIAKKDFMRKRVFNGITDGELKNVTLMACRDDKCIPFREGMEKEAGIKFYAKDERGRFQPVDQPKKEGPHI